MSVRQYPSYPVYEESGIISCPMRPNYWGVTRLKFISELNPSKSQVGHLDPATIVTFLPMEAIGENGELDVSRERLLQDVRNGYTFLGDGDVCIAKITPCFENGKGAVISATLNGVAFATTEVIPFRCKRSEDARFLYYLLTSEPFKADAEASMYGAGGQKRVADSFAGNYSVVLPPPAERLQIAAFLDCETAKIDALIEKQQKLIALLKEKRQAVISHAVTKGLNPDAPMRDSGVEWLGEVPAHWEVVKLYHLTSRIGDGLHGTPSFQDGTGLYFVNGNNLEDGRIVIGDTAKEVPAVEYERYRIPMSHSTVLLSINGTIGKVAIYADEKVILGKSAAYINCISKLKPGFLQVFFQSHNARRYYELVSTGTTISNLSLDSIRQLRIGLPDLNEQEDIIEYCVKQSKKYGDLIEVASAIVEKLHERRTALISAAVTGKIDVRNWKPAQSKTYKEANP